MGRGSRLKIGRWSTFLGCVGLLLGTLACGVQKTSNTVAVTVQGAGFDAFLKVVHPNFRQSCAQCHGTGQAPLFAVSSATQAYTLVRNGITPRGFPIVRLDEVEASRVLSMAMETSHCPQCDGATAERLKDALETWADVELSSGTPVDPPETPPGGGGLFLPNPSDGVQLAVRTIPSALFTTPCFEDGSQACNTFQTLEFPLGPHFPGVPGASSLSITVEVQVYFNGYRFRNVRLTGGSTTNRRVRDVRLLINGGYYPNQHAFRSIDVTASGITALLSSANVILPQVNGVATPGDDVTMVVGGVE